MDKIEVKNSGYFAQLLEEAYDIMEREGLKKYEVRFLTIYAEDCEELTEDDKTKALVLNIKGKRFYGL
ncbi:MAG: hypothetical protein MUE53_05320 [Chitinophagales bacterium]|jgi:hypothetical protein|nr:hypothetical protein [Chitinophagales bacterium]